VSGVTTFNELKTRSNTNKIYLAELTLGEHLSSGSWTKLTGHVYSKTYRDDTIMLASGASVTVRKELEKIKENGTTIIQKTSLALVKANTPSFFHNVTQSTLYLHTSNGSTPNQFTEVGYFTLRFGTEPKVLYSGGSKYYEPYITENGIPRLSANLPSIYWGITNISAGNLQLDNSTGFFDQISKKYLWIKKRCKLLVGGEDLPYSEYKTMFTGEIYDKTYTRLTLDLAIRSTSFDLLRSIPINHFWTSNFPNMDPAAEGKSIPVYYGIYDINQAPLVTCINTSMTTANNRRFKICDHPVSAITGVYLNFSDVTGWIEYPVDTGYGSVDLTNATFIVTAASYVTGQTKCKVAFHGAYSTASGTTSGAPEIVEDILLRLCGKIGDDLNTVSFTTSKTDSDVALNVPIENEVSALSVIDKICKSDLAFFDEDADGKYRYRTWSPLVTSPGALPSIQTDRDFTDMPRMIDDTVSLFYKIRVRYSYSANTKESLQTETSDVTSRYKYEKSEVLDHDTYIRGKSDADTLAQRLNLVLKDPSPILTGKTKLQLVDKVLGDKIKITMARSPFEVAGGYVGRVFEIFSISKQFSPAEVEIRARDLKELGGQVGFWTASTAPTWANANSDDKAISGFWTDADGYIDTANEDTLNGSTWW